MKYYTTSKLSENIHTTPEGYLLCVGVSIARTGEMVYGEGETPLEPDDEGRVLIQREAEEVFRSKTIASFEGKPVTITHPTDFVTPENWQRLAVGIMQNVRRGTGGQKDDLIADLLITDANAINLVKNGLREVSCGYDAEYVQDTESGQGFQTKIIGNHLALVKEGRAGPDYAIHDHKGKGANVMTLKEKFKKYMGFGFTADEAAELMKDAEEKPASKKDDDKDKAKDAGAYDELVQICKDLGEKVAALSASKDAEEKPAPKKDDDKSKDADGEEKPAPKKKDDSSEDDGEEMSDEEVAPALEDRLKKLEASVAKILEAMGSESEDDMGGNLVGDEEGEESEDDDFEESTMTGDTASRAEILAPGIKRTKDVKVKALKALHGTKEGKVILEALNGGKAPTFDSKEKVNSLFIAASEVMKHSRQKEFSGTKRVLEYQSTIDAHEGVMTPEKMNEINAKHYKRN